MRTDKFIICVFRGESEMSAQEHTRTLLKGTAILAFAAFVSKLLGVVYRIPYQNITGDTGLFVYEQVYPLYMILLTLATAGFPIAISRLVAESLTHGDVKGARRIFKVSFILLGISGVVCFTILFFMAPYVSRLMGSGEDLTLAIRSVSFALIIVPAMATIRGYFQGHQNMVPTAISQVVEQFVRVGTILILGYFLFINFGAYYAGAGAVFGAFTGALAAITVLGIFWKRNERKQQEVIKSEQNEQVNTDAEGNMNSLSVNDNEKHVSYVDMSLKQVLKRILYYSLPISLAALVLPLFLIVDNFTIVNLLQVVGWEQNAAEDLRGVFGRGQPLVQFAAFFATALALSLVPSISEAKAKRSDTLIASRIHIALKLTLVVGFASSFGLFILAEPINVMMYTTIDGTTAIAILAFITIFTTLSITTGAILQGLGHVMLPAKHLFIGVIVKAILNIMLVPFFDIKGAALASVIAYAVAACLNLWALKRITHLTFPLKPLFVLPFISVIVMTLIVWGAREGMVFLLQDATLPFRLYHTMIALSGVLIGMIAYGLTLIRMGAVTRNDLNYIPKMSRVIPLLERLKILR